LEHDGPCAGRARTLARQQDENADREMAKSKKRGPIAAMLHFNGAKPW
jgi:hypothetical protein